MYERLGYTGGISLVPWPKYDEKAMQKQEFEIAVQLNGKIKQRIMIPADMTAKDAESFVLSHTEVAPLIAGKNIVKFIYVSNRLANIIIK